MYASPGVPAGSELISYQNFPFLCFTLFKLGSLPPSLPRLFSLSPLSAFEDGAHCASACLALHTKGGLFHEMFPFLMSDGVFAHLIFCTDISPGAECASKQQRGCKWEWVREGRRGGDSDGSGKRRGEREGGGCIENTNTGLFILPDI